VAENYLYPDGIFCDAANDYQASSRSEPSSYSAIIAVITFTDRHTIFHKSPTPLTVWFYAIYLMASTRCEFRQSRFSGRLASPTKPRGACSTDSHDADDEDAPRSA